MGIAAQFSKHLHREIDAHAAWLPIANNFAIGDYGLVSDGVFNRMGNISEFGVNATGTGTNTVQFDFKSEGTNVVSLVGDAQVSALPAEPIDAKLKVEFSKKDAYLAKAAKASVTEIPNLAQVAAQLAKAKGWKRKYRVVWTTVTAEDALIVTSRAANASFELSGKADVLKQFGLGGASAGVSIASENDVGLSIVGETGVVGLKLFKLKLWGDEAKMLGPGDEAEIEEDEGDELEDDV